MDAIAALVGTPVFPSWDTLFKELDTIRDDTSNVITNALLDPTTGLANLYTVLANGINYLTVGYYSTTALRERLNNLDTVLPYPIGGYNNVHEDFVGTRTAVTVVQAVTELLKIRLGGGAGVAGDLLSNLTQLFENHSGTNTALTLEQLLSVLSPAPPLSSLSIGSTETITSDVEFTRPNGAYGLRFAFAPPASWAKHAGIPERYIPALARIAYNTTIGTYLNLDSVALKYPVVYPLQRDVYSLTIHMEPGVTGEYTWLLLS